MVVDARWQTFLAVQSHLAIREARQDFRAVLGRFAERAQVPVDRYIRMHPQASRLLAQLDRAASGPDTVDRIPLRRLMTAYWDWRLYFLQEVEFENMQRELVHMEMESEKCPLSRGLFVYLWHQIPRARFYRYPLAQPPAPDPAGWMPDGQVVSMHGMFQDLRSLAPLTDALVKDALQLHWAFDLPGFGASYLDHKTLSDQAYRAAALPVLREARDRYPDHPITLLAFSMGATFALGLVRDHPDLVDQLILISPLLSLKSEEGLFDLIFHQVAPSLATAHIPTPQPFTRREALQGLKGSSFHHAIEGVVQSMSDRVLSEGFRFPKRTLVVLNPNDAVASAEATESFFGDGRPNVHMHRYRKVQSHGSPDSSHDLYLDEEVQEAVRQFILDGYGEDTFYHHYIRPWDQQLREHGYRRRYGRLAPIMAY